MFGIFSAPAVVYGHVRPQALLASGALDSKTDAVWEWGRLIALSIDFPIGIYWGSYQAHAVRVQEPCESRGGRPGLFVLMSLTDSVDVKQH